MTLKISSKLSLPDDAVLWTFADLAIRGAGKTYVASVLAEEMVKAGTPIVAIDSMGIWWGLRVGVDGKPGLPVVVFGGSHKDLSIPIRMERTRPIVDEDRLKLMVKAILEGRISAVIDTSEFSKTMQRRIVTIFVNELYRLNARYGVRHVFVEEADQWCPQRLSGDLAASAGAIDDLVRRGGNFNLGCTLITQRSAVLNKDVLSQCNCLIVLRTLHKLDKKAVESWVESMAQPEDPGIKKWYDSLRGLRDGEAWIWHPQTKLFEKIQFRKRETLHATREYFRQSEFEQKNIHMMDVDEFVTKFRKVFEPAKLAHDPRAVVIARYPDPGEAPRGKQPGVPVAFSQPRPLESGAEESLREPVVPTGKPFSDERVSIQQALPKLVIEQFKPTVGLSVESLNQPTTALGMAAMVLKNNAQNNGRNDRWTIKRISQHIRDHAWDEKGGLNDAVDQLIRWEILVKLSNGYLRFDPQRVEIRERATTLNVN